jgi:hypothetical protein
LDDERYPEQVPEPGSPEAQQLQQPSRNEDSSARFLGRPIFD